MSLMKIRLELARDQDFPEGSADRGYEFVAPLGADRRIDEPEWKANRDRCRVRRFWSGKPDLRQESDEPKGQPCEGRPGVNLGLEAQGDAHTHGCPSRQTRRETLFDRSKPWRAIPHLPGPVHWPRRGDPRSPPTGRDMPR